MRHKSLDKLKAKMIYNQKALLLENCILGENSTALYYVTKYYINITEMTIL